MLFMFTTSMVYGQNLSGRVVDKDTQKPIGFASIFYKSKNLGIYTENDGSFKIESVSNDTLVINALGYQSIEIASAELNSPKVFQLTSITYEVENVLIEQSVISKIGNKKLTIGNLSKSKTTLVSGMKGRTLAFHIGSKEKALAYISALNFGISSINEAWVKVHIFSVDEESGRPGEPLLLGDNVVRVKKGQKKIHYKLAKRKLLMPQKGVFAAIEWIGNVNPQEASTINPYYTSSHSKDYIPTFTRFMGKGWQEQILSSVAVPSNSKESKYFLEPNFRLTLRY